MNNEQLRLVIADALLGFTSNDPEVRNRCYDLVLEIAGVEKFRSEAIGALYDKINSARRAPDVYRYIRSLSKICVAEPECTTFSNTLGEMIPDALQKGDVPNLIGLLNAVERMGPSAAQHSPLLVQISTRTQNAEVRAANAAAAWAILKP